MTGKLIDDSAPEPELIDERTDERLDTARLEPYLREKLAFVDAAGHGLEVRQFAGGRANLTYLVVIDGTELVLRRPPLGKIAPGAHDMAREHRVLSRLSAHFELAPQCYLYCDDETIIGAPFQVMERRHGIVIRKALPPTLEADMPLRARVLLAIVDTLADLHAVDRVAAGLADLGRPEGYMQRQLEGWAKRWYAAIEAPDAAMDALIDYLRQQLPSNSASTLVHNDYKLDNLLLAPTPPHAPVAVLDWDMCTSGDPLSDVGYLLNQWVEPGDPREWIEASPMPTAGAGFPTRREAIERYARRSGRDVEQIDWYSAFAAMKFAVIIQQIYIRFLRGQTQDARFADFGERARVYIDKGLHSAREGL